MKTFIVGPKASGKTIFALGIYDFLVRKKKVDVLDTGVIVGSTNTTPESLNELLANILNAGDYVERGTPPEVVKIYKFTIKGWVENSITFADYAGEYFDMLSRYIQKDEFKNLVESFKKDVLNNSNLSDDDKKKLGKKLETGKININDLKKLSPLGATSLIVPIYLIGRIKRSDKLIFIVDGDKLKKY